MMMENMVGCDFNLLNDVVNLCWCRIILSTLNIIIWPSLQRLGTGNPFSPLKERVVLDLHNGRWG